MLKPLVQRPRETFNINTPQVASLGSAPLTSVHSRLQAHQEVGQPGLPGAGKVLHVAAVLLQVTLAGLGQRVTDFVVLGNQLLACGQRVTALQGTG